MMDRCANCGIAEGDGVKLRSCSACHLVKYCGVKCQKEHRTEHKRACKKRVAELKDELLFKQPESSHLGDCPICFLPLSLRNDESILTICCSKVICMGCNHFNIKREREENLQPKCPFCRHLITPDSAAESLEKLKRRAVEMECPLAMREVGYLHHKERDFQAALDYFSKAARLGDAESSNLLGEMYHRGEGVKRDKSKAIYLNEQAALRGHPRARCNLGGFDWENGRCDRAIKHWLIAAKLGCDISLKNLKETFKHGLVSKDNFAAALRAQQAAVDATKSPQREEAVAYEKKYGEMNNI